MRSADLLELRLDAIQERLDARRVKQAPGQLGLFGDGQPCGEGWISKEKTCHKGKGKAAAKPVRELDTTSVEVRQRFMETMKEQSIHRYLANFTARSLAAGLLTMCDEPGLAGENARKLARYIDQAGILVTIDEAYDMRREKQSVMALDHYMEPEALAKLRKVDETSANMLGQVEEHKKVLHELRLQKDKARNYSELAVIDERIRVRRETLNNYIHSTAADLLGRPGAAGLARFQQRTISMRDDRDQPATSSWNSAELVNPSLMRQGVEEQLANRREELPGTFTMSGRVKTANNRVMSTFIHEMGHFVQYDADDGSHLPLISGELAKRIRLEPTNQSIQEEKRTANLNRAAAYSRLESANPRNFVSPYAQTNQLEFFAETFTAYIIAPDALKKHSSPLYDYIDKAFNHVLDNQGKDRLKTPAIFP